MNPSLVKRLKAVNASPALFTTYAYYNPDKFVYYGEEMMKNCMAFRSLLIPLVSAVFNILSVLAAYGVVVAVFQNGIGASWIGAFWAGPPPI